MSVFAPVSAADSVAPVARAMGFSRVSTGGGCEAWEWRAGADHRSLVLVLTGEGGACVPTSLDEADCLLGVYSAEQWDDGASGECYVTGSAGALLRSVALTDPTAVSFLLYRPELDLSEPVVPLPPELEPLARFARASVYPDAY
jgi:hypothetical protein